MFARRVLGITYDRWQQTALNRALVYGADGRLLHRLYLISTGRQQGKTGLVRGLIGWALTAAHTPQWRRILGLAHDSGQARIPYEAVMADLAPLAHRYGRSALRITRYLGIRSDLYGRHREYHTGSREARNAVRGTTNSLALFDEVLTQRDWATWAALEPTMTAEPEPLVLATSTMGDDRSIVLREWWERGRRIIDGAEPARGFGMTVYAAPDDMDPGDPRAWRAANPAVAEGRIPIDRIAEAFAGPPSVFRSERLNLWSDAVDEWLPPGVWVRQTGPQPDLTRCVFGVEAVPSWRRASIIVAMPTGEGAWFGIVGYLDTLGTGRSSVAPAELVAELERLRAIWHPEAVAYSTSAAAAPHIESWAEGADVRSVGLTARGLRQASELFRSELIGGRLMHSDDALLASQARSARPSGPLEAGDWYLSIRASAGDIDAVRAGAWASWLVIAPEETPLGPQVFV